METVLAILLLVQAFELLWIIHTSRQNRLRDRQISNLHNMMGIAERQLDQLTKWQGGR